jgi:CRISPR/Cas system Type II protein with McrA/HNH and RuvC-like nuclease domain
VQLVGNKIGAKYKKNGSLQEYTDMNNVNTQQELLQKACRNNTTVKAQLKYDDEMKHHTLRSIPFTTWVSNLFKAKAHIFHCGLGHRPHMKK